MLLMLAGSCAGLNRVDPCDTSVQIAAEPESPGRAGARLRVVTHNVHGESSRAIARGITGSPVLRRADVVLLQEVEHHSTEGRSRAAQVAANLGMAHAYAPGYGLPRGGSHGVAILSRFPLSDVELIELPRYSVHFNSARRVALAATATVGDAQVRIYSVHLDNRVNPKHRLAQMSPVLDAARDHGVYRVIIAGDLNTSPFCWLARTLPVPCGRLARRLERRVRLRGFGTPVTSAGATSKWLAMRLDAIYTRGLPALDFGVDRSVRLSDHLPLWIDVEL